MPTKKNIETVEELTGKLSRCTVTIGTGISGMSMKKMTDLRHHLRSQDVEYRVVKNTLTQLAAQAAGRPETAELLEGPTGLVLGYGDPMSPIRTLVEYVKTNRIPLKINGVVLDGTVYKNDAAVALASLPSHQELIAQLVNQLSSPASRLVTVLTKPMQGLVLTINGPLAALANVLQQRVSQKG